MIHSADWAPSTIRWRANGPLVEWCHLGDLRFTHPFFEQTIVLAMQHPFNLLFRHGTPLADLRGADTELKLAGFIFHMSRCGSTVVTQMLAALARNVVLSEPTPLDQILRAPARLRDLSEDQLVAWLRGMVAAMGRKRRTEERELFIKLDAWHVLMLPLLRRAFPNVPWIFLYRDPLEVLVSHAQSRPVQMFPGSIDPALLASDPAVLGAMSPDAYTALVLSRCLDAAIAHHQGGLLVAYDELPEIVCTTMLDHFALRYSEAEIGAMRAAAQHDAKNPNARFRPDGEAKRNSASEELRTLARELAPLHARLEALRLASRSNAGALLGTSPNVEP